MLQLSLVCSSGRPNPAQPCCLSVPCRWWISPHNCLARQVRRCTEMQRSLRGKRWLGFGGQQPLHVRAWLPVLRQHHVFYTNAGTTNPHSSAHHHSRCLPLMRTAVTQLRGQKDALPSSRSGPAAVLLQCLHRAQWLLFRSSMPTETQAGARMTLDNRQCVTSPPASHSLQTPMQPALLPATNCVQRMQQNPARCKQAGARKRRAACSLEGPTRRGTQTAFRRLHMG